MSNHLNRFSLWVITLVIIIAVVFIFHETIINSFAQLIFTIQYWQNQFQRFSSLKLASLRQGNVDSQVVYSLLALSWLYGLLHAAGPGHGKAIITTWALTQRERYSQILLLSSLGALLQAFSALFWVALTIGLAQWFIRDSIEQSIWLNRFSYALLIVIGVYVIVRAIKNMRHTHQTHHCHCTHHQPHQLNLPDNQLSARLVAILAIGLRPCSGALIILAVAASWQLWSVGILMTFAMALGTAVTVGLFGLLVNFGRQQITDMLLSKHTTRYRHIVSVVSILLGLGLCAIGVALLFNTPPVSTL